MRRYHQETVLESFLAALCCVGIVLGLIIILSV